MTAYVELQVTKHPASSAAPQARRQLFAAVALLGLLALGVVDRGAVAGMVSAWDTERTTRVRAVVGARLPTGGCCLAKHRKWSFVQRVAQPEQTHKWTLQRP